jgi:hypothetical protein
LSNLNKSNNAGSYSFVSQYMSISLDDNILLRLQGQKDYNDLGDAKLYSILAHESTHYIQNISTTYGLWKTITMRFAGHYALEAVKKYTLEYNKPIQVPLKNNITNNQKIIKKDYQINIAMAHNLMAELSFIDGHIKFPTNYEPQWIHAEKPKESTHIGMISTDNISLTMGGNDLLEFYARSVEYKTLYRTNGISENHRNQILPTLERDIQSKIPLKMTDYIFKEKSHDTWMASLAMVEIALNPDWELFGLRNFKKNNINKKSSWEELHPSHRFKKLCEILKNNNIKPPKGNYLEFQNILCKHAGWKLPTDVLKHAMIEIKNKDNMYFAIIFDLLKIVDDYILIAEKEKSLIHDLMNTKKFHNIMKNKRGPKIINYNNNGFYLKEDIALQLLQSDSMICSKCFKDGYHDKGCDMEEFEKMFKGIK